MAGEGDRNKTKEAEVMAVPNLNMECIRSLRATRKKLIKNGDDGKRSPGFEPGQNSPTRRAGFYPKLAGVLTSHKQVGGGAYALLGC